MSSVITKTSLLATRALVALAQEKPGTVSPPREIAMLLGESPAYMAKVLHLLVKTGILRAERGMKGGVYISRPPGEITLLKIVEACQGTITGSHCQEIGDLQMTCAFHQASVELRESMLSVLSRWSLAQLANVPRPSKPLPGSMHCMMINSPVSNAEREHRSGSTKRSGPQRAKNV